MRLVPILVAAALAIGWLLHDRDAGGAPPSAEPVDPSPTAATEPPMLLPAGRAVPDDDPILDSPEVEETEPPELMPDPVELGSCTLELVLARDDTQAAMEGLVELWRLDAPANPGWSAGDKRQKNGKLSEGRVTFKRLPPGRYRIHAHGQRRDTEDPPAFTVEGDWTNVRLLVPAPVKRRVYVRLLDEHGTVIESAIRRDRGRMTTTRPPETTPTWVKHRHPTNGARAGTIGIGGGAGGAFRTLSRRITGDVRGFEHGLEPDDTRYVHRRRHYELLVEGRSTTQVAVGGEVPRERTYVAVAIPLDFVYDRVLLPDRARAIDRGAAISVSSKTVLVTHETPYDIHRRLKIAVKAELEGYEPLELEFTLGDDDWERTLVPKEKEG